jgi:type III secretion system chaperone SycN
MLDSEIIRAFGRRLGLGDIGQTAPFVLHLEGLGQLTLEAAGDDLMLSLALPLPPHDDTRLLAALSLCYPDRVLPFSLGCGLHKDHLFFISRQKSATLTAATLENQAIFLINNARTAGFPG